MKLISIFLFLTIVFCNTIYAKDLNFFIGSNKYISNGELKEVDSAYDVAPFIQKSSNRSMVPIRCIVEELGGSLSWDADTKSFTINYGDNTMILTIDKAEAIVNDSVWPLDAAPVIKNSRSFVPLRFIADSFGAKVNWISENQAIEIFLPDDNPDDSISVLMQLQKPKSGDKIAVIKTNFGDIKILLFPNEAPKAVENFVTHSQNGYYNGLTFHRVIKDFMIQGGDPLGTGVGGESIWGEPFVNEYSANLHHFRGALAMANAGSDTNGSQFFIVHSKTVDDESLKLLNLIKETPRQISTDINGNDILSNQAFADEIIEAYEELGGTPALDYKYTVFGQVFSGMDTVDKISEVEVILGGFVDSKPIEDVLIQSIEIQEIS